MEIRKAFWTTTALVVFGVFDPALAQVQTSTTVDGQAGAGVNTLSDSDGAGGSVVSNTAGAFTNTLLAHDDSDPLVIDEHLSANNTESVLRFIAGGTGTVTVTSGATLASTVATGFGVIDISAGHDLPTLDLVNGMISATAGDHAINFDDSGAGISAINVYTDAFSISGHVELGAADTLNFLGDGLNPLSGNIIANNGAGNQINVNLNASTDTLSIGGTIDGLETMTVTQGDVTLGGAYTNGTDIDIAANGTLRSHAGGLTVSNNIDVTGGIFISGGTVNANTIHATSSGDARLLDDTINAKVLIEQGKLRFNASTVFADDVTIGGNGANSIYANASALTQSGANSSLIITNTGGGTGNFAFGFDGGAGGNNTLTVSGNRNYNFNGITIQNYETLDYSSTADTLFNGTAFSGANNINITGSGKLTFTEADNAFAVSNNITIDAGELDISGQAVTLGGQIDLNDGTLTVDGTSVISGNLDVNTGAGSTTAINNDVTFGAGSESLTFSGNSGGSATFSNGFNGGAGAGDTLNLSNSAGTLTLSGIISNFENLNVNGGGAAVLSGVNTYSGATSITAGTLSVNGSIANSTTTIGAAGTLKGTGTTGDVIANGTLAPGNSIGTLNVAGNLTYNIGSTYEVELNAAGNSDKIIATGNITINGGTVDVQAAAGTYNTTTDYTILQGASVAGTFDSVTSNLAFLTPSLTYNAADVVLTMARNDLSFASADPSSQDVADAMEGLGPGNALYDAFSGLSLSQATTALKTISGEHNASLSTSAHASNAAVRNILTGRMQGLSHTSDIGQTNLAALRPVQNHDGGLSQGDGLRLAAMEPAAGDDNVLALLQGNNRLWGEVFGSFGKSDAQGSASSQKRESGGTLIGMDFGLSDNLDMGFFGGWERGEVYTDSQNSNSDIDSWHGGVYASYVYSPQWRLSGGLNGSYHKVDTTRHVEFPGFSETYYGDTNGYTVTGYTELGYTIDTPSVAWEPFVGFNITHSYMQGYTETGAASGNLVAADERQNVFGHTLGIRGAKGFKMPEAYYISDLSLRGKLGWDHNYGDLSNDASMRFAQGTTEFQANGLGIARNTFLIGTELEAAFKHGAKAYFSYDGSLANDSRDHILTLGVKFKF